MKKLFILVLAVALCFTVTACGSEKKPAQQDATEVSTTEIPEETTVPPEGHIEKLAMYEIFSPQNWIISKNANEKNRIILFNTSKSEEVEKKLQRITVKVEEGSSTQEQNDKKFEEYKTSRLSSSSSTATVSDIEFDTVTYTANGIKTTYYQGLANGRIMTILVESGSEVEDMSMLDYIVESITVKNGNASIPASEAETQSEAAVETTK